MHGSARIRRRPSSGVTRSRGLTSTWRRRLPSSTRSSTPLHCSRTRSRSSTWDRARGEPCSSRRSSRSRRSSASNSHRICTASRKRTSSDTARRPSSARHFELHCMDVVDYDYGPEPPVLFLFDPFGRETLRSVIANLEASLRARASRRLCRLRLPAVRGCVAGLTVSCERSEKAAPRGGPGAGMWFTRRRQGEAHNPPNRSWLAQPAPCGRCRVSARTRVPWASARSPVRLVPVTRVQPR